MSQRHTHGDDVGDSLRRGLLVAHLVRRRGIFDSTTAAVLPSSTGTDGLGTGLIKLDDVCGTCVVVSFGEWEDHP